jgi:flagellar motor component MotA
LEIVRFVNVVCAGLVTGAMLMELGVIMPSLRSVSDRALIELHQGMMPRASKYIPMFGALTSIAGVVTVFEHDLSDTATVLTIAGLVAWIAAVLITYRFYLPVAVGLSASEVDTVPERQHTMRRWHSIHLLRTVFFVAGFGLFVAAALAS